MRALRPIHKHAQTSQVSTVTKWEIAGYAGLLEGNAAARLPPLALSLADARKRTGLKATLQRRLHGLLVQAAIEERDEEESDSDGDGGAAGAASPPAPRGPARRVRARRS